MAVLMYLAVVVAITISTSEADQLEEAVNFEERAVPEDNSQYSDQEPKVKQVRDIEVKEAGIALELDNTQSRTLRQTLSSIIPLNTNSVDSRLSSLSTMLDSARQEIASIQTRIRRPIPRAVVNIRLAGSYGNQGRVEVSVNGGAWGTVCDDGWDNNDATVVCRSLGFGSATARTNAFFGQGTGNILLDDVNCTGNEYNIVQCRSQPFGVHDCGHHEDAGVVCSN